MNQGIRLVSSFAIPALLLGSEPAAAYGAFGADLGAELNGLAVLIWLPVILLTALSCAALLWLLRTPPASQHQTEAAVAVETLAAAADIIVGAAPAQLAVRRVRRSNSPRRSRPRRPLTAQAAAIAAAPV